MSAPPTNPPAFLPDQLLHLLASVPTGIALLDAELRYLWINEFLAGLNGHSVQAHIGRQVSELAPEPVVEQFQRLYSRALREDRAEGALEVVEGRPPGSGRSEHWAVRVFPPAPMHDGRRAVLVTVSCVTELVEQNRRQADAEGGRLAMAVEGARLGLWEYDLASERLTCNAQWYRMRGFEPQSPGQPYSLWLSSIHPEDRERVREKWEAHRRGESTWFASEYRLCTAAGEWLWVLDRGRIMERDATGKPLRAAGTHIDISVLKKAQHRLEESEAWLRLAQEAAGVATWEWDPTRGQARFSENIAALFGLAPGESIESIEKWSRYIHPDDLPRLLADNERLMSSPNHHIETEYRVVWPDGSVHWLSTVGRTLGDEGSDSTLFIGVNRDITEKRNTETALRDSEKRFNSAFNFAAVPMALLDQEGEVELINPAMEKLLGYDLEQLRHHGLTEITHAEDVESSRALFGKLKAGTIGEYSEEKRYLHRSGEARWVSASTTVMPGSDGRPDHYIHQALDITRERKRTDQLSWEASHDPLTGLCNRREFERRLRRLTEKGGFGDGACLAFMDLDGFKPINDTCGHDAGDEFLHGLAQVLLENTRGRDTLARLGGDEFALLLEHCSLTDAQAALEKLSEVVRSYRYECRGHEVGVTVSVGLTAIREETTASRVLREADEACYAAKAAGRDRLIVYS